jgi:hypothetical protein
MPARIVMKKQSIIGFCSLTMDLGTLVKPCTTCRSKTYCHGVTNLLSFADRAFRMILPLMNHDYFNTTLKVYDAKI